MKFFLGTHQPSWFTATTEALFVCDRRLRDRKTMPQARGEWALDSGGFTELKDYGSWSTTTPQQYVGRARRYRDEIGHLAWAAPQDWMCEPIIIHGGRIGTNTFVGTGLTVAEHQRRTVDNLLHLRSLAPDLPFIPVLQGWHLDDYLHCAQLYTDAGIDLATEPTVGIGSVCRREATTEAAAIISAITTTVPGIRLHGFGIKTAGLGAYGSMLESSDSLAWSYAARRSPALPGCTGHKNCANCITYAFQWRHRVLASLAGHATRTSLCTNGSRPISLSRKLDRSTPASQRLRLSGFRDEAARLERDTTIRWAHRDGMTIRQIATLMGLSPARVGQITAGSDDRPLLEQLRELRHTWNVDTDPATRTAADHIIATLAAAELSTRDSESPTAVE
ncbi:helix-turn-helix domain-containing protein [Nocardia salmonicida]|uniref:helix-turn-helix domain-containing protein n=1 Tax=Nocardia salmonicida TaxID=53431 RepID=UPI00340185AD